MSTPVGSGKSSTSSSSGKLPTQKNIPLDTSFANDNIPALITVPNESKESLETWLSALYNVSDVTTEFINQLFEAFSYKGFNREDVLRQLHLIAGNNKRIAIELIVVTALRGPQAASNIKLSNGKTPKDMNIPASGGRGTKKLTLNKIQAATADLAAYFLKQMKVPKRLNLDLPGWLQFPSAGGIKLPMKYREQHRVFHKVFSEQIGGIFNEQIYMTMETNSYLDDKLNLFIE